MDSISQWILSVAGVALIGVVADIILPEGQMQKYCRSIFALIMLLVIILPIPKLINQEFVLNLGGTSIETDKNFIENSYRSRVTLLESGCEQYLQSQGYDDVDIIIFVNEYSPNMRILSVQARGVGANSQSVTQLIASYLSITPNSIVCFK